MPLNASVLARVYSKSSVLFGNLISSHTRRGLWCTLTFWCILHSCHMLCIKVQSYWMTVESFVSSPFKGLLSRLKCLDSTLSLLTGSRLPPDHRPHLLTRICTMISYISYILSCFLNPLWFTTPVVQRPHWQSVSSVQSSSHPGWRLASSATSSFLSNGEIPPAASSFLSNAPAWRPESPGGAATRRARKEWMKSAENFIWMSVVWD